MAMTGGPGEALAPRPPAPGPAPRGSSRAMSPRAVAPGQVGAARGPAASASPGQAAPFEHVPTGRRSGPFASPINLLRMTLAVAIGMVLGAFICAALGY